jgi:hypothetical protein
MLLHISGDNSIYPSFSTLEQRETGIGGTNSEHLHTPPNRNHTQCACK